VALIKPQFEAGRAQVKRGGVVRDAAVHQSVLVEVLTAASRVGLWPHGLMRSPLRGPAGNVEFLAWLRQEAAPHTIEQLAAEVLRRDEEATPQDGPREP